MIARWTRGVIHFRFVVIALWLAVVIVGTLASRQLPTLLSISLAVPGTSSEQANTILAEHFGINPDGTFTVVFRVAHPSADTIRTIAGRLSAAARVIPTAHDEQLSVGTDIVYGDLVTALDLQSAAKYTGRLRRALDYEPGLPKSYVTGEPAIQHDLTPLLAADLRRGELIALPIALLALCLVLGVTAALLVPFLFALATITATLGVVDGLAHEFMMASYIPNLVELIGLGLAIDYSLLTVHRFREELAHYDDVDAAIVHTMSTAGRSALWSGASVALGLSMILFLPVPFIRSVGVAGLLVPLLSMLTMLTLQPALLSVFGRRGMEKVRLRNRTERSEGAAVVPSGESAADAGPWAGFARTVMHHRLAILAGSIAVLLLAIVPVAALQLTPGSIFAIPKFTQSARGEVLLLENVGAGALTPTEVVIDAGAPGRTRAPAVAAATLRLARELAADPEVFVVEIGSKPPYVDTSVRYSRVVVGGRHEFGSEVSQQLVREMRMRLIPEARFPTGVSVYTGGAPAEGVDFLARVYGAFPWVVLAVLALAFLMLLVAFGSLVLAAMAVLLDLVSVGVAYGLLVVTFHLGVGADVLGLYRVGQIEGWIPVLLFAVLFGLSMDYEVFLVTRMRESWEAGADTEGAITEGIKRTGRVVSAAALVMVVTFAGFLVGHVADLQEFGAGLALGVLVDATIVRLLLLPSLMSVLGRWNWWLPGSDRFGERDAIEPPSGEPRHA